MTGRACRDAAAGSPAPRAPRDRVRPAARRRQGVHVAGGRRPSPSRASTWTSRPGEFVSLIGPSGCGKSTLLRIVGDLIAPTAGTVEVNGKPAHQARLDRDYGMVFQAPVLFDWRTVEANVRLPLEVMGSDAQSATGGCARCSTWWSWAASCGTTRTSSRAACSSASPSRARCVPAGAAADGRAVRRARRDDPRAAQRRGAAHLGADRHDRHLRHPLDPGGRVPVHAGRGHERAAGPHRRGHRHRPAAAARRGDARERALLRAGDARCARACAGTDHEARRGAPSTLGAARAPRRAFG